MNPYWVEMNSLYDYNRKLSQLYLYGFNKGMLTKKQIMEEPFSFYIRSSFYVYQTVELQVDYMCNENKDKKIAEVCSSSTLLHLNIHNKMISYIQYKSFNLGVVFILFTASVALFLLCRFKYKSIYRAYSKRLRELMSPDHVQI